MPEALRRPIRAHPRELLPLLFRASASALLDVCANPQWFGAVPGVTAVLHTWTRQLEYHPHVHFLVTGGGVDQRGVWRESQPGFLVPVHALSKLFRARFRDALKKRFPEIFARLPTSLWNNPWVVHVEPVGSGAQALRYLSRYLYRVALSNTAILRADDPSTGSGQASITFRYRDSGDRRPRSCTLAPPEFLRRFLQHVLPKGFVKIRYFGLHHPARRRDLSLARAALCLRAGRQVPAAPSEPTAPPPCLCPRCRTPMRRTQRLHPQAARHPFARGPPTP